MSNSNVIYHREWRDKPLDEPRRRCFASTREIRQLLQAFCAIESALVRAEIIRTVQDAAALGSVKRPPQNSA